jgi:chemotaxis signal transduction protein
MSQAENRYLVFNVSGERYALSLQDVEEILELPEIHPLPKAPAYYTGVMNCHSMPVPIVDLALFLKKESPLPGEKIVVLHRKIANLALRVHAVKCIAAGVVMDEPDGDTDGGMAKMVLIAEVRTKLLCCEKLLEQLEEEALSR